MTEQNQPPAGNVPYELLQLVNAIAHEAIQADVREVPEILSRILEAAHLLIGPEPGTVSLLDYVFDERSVLEDISVGTFCQNVSGITGFSLTDEFLSSLPAPISWEVSSFRREDGYSLITVPLIANARQVGLLCLVPSRHSTDLDNERQHLLQTLGGLAAITIDRRRTQTNAVRLRDWLDALREVFAASRVTDKYEDVNQLLRVIGDTARRISDADLVIFYEFIETLGGVRVPSVYSGELKTKIEIPSDGDILTHKTSAISRLLELKQPFFANNVPHDWIEEGLLDLANDSEDISFFQREGIVSSAGIPLRFDKERVGILFLNYRAPRIFSSDFREQFQLFANHAALAIANKQLLLRTKRSSSKLETLNLIGRELNSAVTLDIQKIGELIYEQTRKVILTSNFFLCLYDAETSQFSIPYLRDQHDSVEILEPKLQTGLTAYVCRKGEALLASLPQQKRLFAKNEAEPEGRPPAIWLGAPLIIRDKVIGALVVQDYDSEAAFDEEDMQLLRAIASNAAIAIDNYRLLYEANLRLRELEALLDTSQAFGTYYTSSELFSSILDHICEVASCDGALLLLKDLAGPHLLEVAASSSRLKRYIGQDSHLYEGVSGHVVKSGRAMVVNDYAGWPYRSLALDPTPMRACATPLLWQQEVIGAMEIFSFEERGAFSQREIEILQRFAGSMAAAVQNARKSSLQQGLVHAGPNAIVGVDKAGRIIMFNEEAANLFKYPSNTAMGQRVSQLYWNGLDDARRIQHKLHEHNKITDLELFGRSQNGDKFPISLSAALLLDDRGVILGSVGIIQDLRLQSLAGRTGLLVEGLRKISREESLSRIIDMIVFYAVELLYADACCLFLQQTESLELFSSYGVDSAHLDRLLTRDSREQLAAWHAQDLHEIFFLPQQESAKRLLRADSQSAVLVPIRTETRLLGLLLIESRETDHFKAEATLIEILAAQTAVSINRVQLLRYRDETQRDLLMRANTAAVGEIATSFIHEAKNSLNGMALTIHNLIEEIDLEPDLESKSDYKERLSTVLSEMQRVDNLSRRLQRFTQLGLFPDKRDVYLNEVVASALNLLDSVLRKKHMRFELFLDPSLDRPDEKERAQTIQVDEPQIQQVIINLVLNAVAVSPERSSVVIETRNTNGNAEIHITDHGSGIAEEIRDKVFTPFFTTKEDGAGLGLFVCKLLIENHGGSIDIERTSPRKGTTFSVKLPNATRLARKVDS
jgi:PAS domain S-box-containing protein